MSPVFPGEKYIDQLCCVLRVLGTSTEEIWPGMKSDMIMSGPGMIMESQV